MMSYVNIAVSAGASLPILCSVVECSGANGMISYKVVVRYGPPEEEITKEVTENTYDLLILGAQQSTTFKAKIGSFNLPGKIFNNLKIPTLFVK